MGCRGAAGGLGSRWGDDALGTGSFYLLTSILLNFALHFQFDNFKMVPNPLGVVPGNEYSIPDGVLAVPMEY